jgi:hypothetical protein
VGMFNVKVGGLTAYAAVKVPHTLLSLIVVEQH